ncbi:EF-hand domain pair [Phytophthora cactorum]|nr:EF-hand domain pair [Phytophthora cactorum]
MSVKKLSPLDLCELFSYGDARKNPLVSLSHVCEVLFDLDPETATGADPVTEEMEEFLYQFATEECGEIMSDNSSSSGLQVVNLHEQELVEIASKLEFTGVKRLEQLLIEEDAGSTGFVTLKQLCWRLVEDFDLKISETRLIELMGMNFNANGQLDYTEFVDVLLDILIYALPDIRESAKRKSIMRLDQYLQSGFPPGRADVRQLLDALCSNYDVKGDQIISVEDLVRVFHVDLVKHHALELPFPLEEHETIQLAHPFIQHKTQDATSGVFPRIQSFSMRSWDHFLLMNR